MTEEAGVEQPTEEASRHDTITAAFDAVEAASVEATPAEEDKGVTTGEEESKGDDKPRDEQGRFVKQEGSEEEPPKGDEDTPPQREYFDSWKKGLEGHVNALPQEVYDEIARREQNIKDGFEQNQTKLAYHDEMQAALQPFMNTITALGISPAQAAQKLFNVDHVLRTAAPSQRVHLIYKLAKNYGVELPELPAEQQVDPALQALQDQVHGLHQEVRSIHTSDQPQAQTTDSPASNQVEQFFADNPGSDQYRVIMAGLIETGKAADLQSAYDLAKRIDQDPVNLEEHREKVRGELEREQKAKEAAASVTGGPQVTTPAVNTNDRRAAIEAAVTAKM